MKNLKIRLFFPQILALIILVACAGEDTAEAVPPCFICPTDFNAQDSEPAWSPDGSWIAFAHADVAGKMGIYLITPDRQKMRRWHLGSASAPAWSPNGRWLAFSEDGQIWKKTFTGDSLTQLTFEGRNFYPTWSSDGRWIAFDALIKSRSRFYAIWKIESDGTTRIPITPLSSDYGDVRMPNWVGNDIVHIRYSKNMSSPDIFLMNQEGGNVARLTFDEAVDYYPKLLRDQKIVFSSKALYAPFYQIWTMNVDGSSLKQLTNSQGYSCAWSPDGTRIVYTDSRAKNGRLWIMDADGDSKRQLTFENDF